MSVRVVTRTVKDGRLSFNQVVMERQDAPAGVLLVGIDPDHGLHVWLRSHADILPHTIPQIDGYSRMLGPFDLEVPPAFLGESVFLSKDEIDDWDAIVNQQTNTLNRAIRELFGVAG